MQKHLAPKILNSKCLALDLKKKVPGIQRSKRYIQQRGEKKHQLIKTEMMQMIIIMHKDIKS